MKVVEFAEQELQKVGLLDEDSDYKGELGRCVLNTIRTFMEYGHSECSLEMGAQLFDRLVRRQPLTAEDPK